MEIVCQVLAILIPMHEPYAWLSPYDHCPRLILLKMHIFVCNRVTRIIPKVCVFTLSSSFTWHQNAIGGLWSLAFEA